MKGASRSQLYSNPTYNAGIVSKRPDYGDATPEDLARALMWPTIERRKAARYRRPDRAERAVSALFAMTCAYIYGSEARRICQVKFIIPFR